jgi:ketosteroid isomerase-like protein
MDQDHLPYFRALYDTFNRRDIAALLQLMTEDVDWPNAWKGGRLRGQPAVRDYWTDQWREIDPHVTPVSVAERPDGALAVTVRQVVRSREGDLIDERDVLHVYRLRDELIARMDVEEPGS